jgi:transposase-like protein
MAIVTGKPIAQVARDLETHDGTLGNWVTKEFGSIPTLIL